VAQREREPADLGSKAQLEAALVAAVLHLLSLVSADTAPPAAAATATPATAVLRGTARQAQLQQLVRQAQLELQLPPPAAELGFCQQSAPAAEGSFEPGLFDVSLVSADLAAAAARGLSRLALTRERL